MRIFGSASYRFIQGRKKAYVISSIAIVAGIAAMIVNLSAIGSWQNYGVDFEGGSLVQVGFEQDVTTGDVRSALGGANGPDVTEFAGENEFLIRAPQAEDATVNQVREEIETALTQAFGADAYVIERTELVGPKIGAELQRKAAFAILISFALTLVYIAIRFELRFGMAAVIATMHDILITLGFLAIFRVEISLPTVAAILTIVGYSLNDTIVVFDRVRENMGKKGARKRDQVDLVNQSINETLPRTILTSGTTLAVLLALLVVGPAVIRDFSVVLILGVIIGTYSSIFVASPALIEIEKRMGEKKPKPEKVIKAEDAIPT
ncbi:MAG TPA: protein translocase subunit SecF [Longimicrobiales bacterium]|nr:protein translocase subunit SecF [Longimicrobiales bacterium]